MPRGFESRWARRGRWCDTLIVSRAPPFRWNALNDQLGSENRRRRYQSWISRRGPASIHHTAEPGTPLCRFVQGRASRRTGGARPRDAVLRASGLGRALDNALSLVTRGGTLSVVLQLPEREQQNVTTTSYPSMQTLAGSFSLVDVSRLRALLEHQGFRLLNEELRPLPTGKTLWLGIFSSAAMGS